MKILVTGGAGFIGAEFVRRVVRKGYEVVVVDALTYAGDLERLKDVEGGYAFHQLDIVDRSGLEAVFRKERPEAVVHIAAESHVDRSILDPAIFIKTNIWGTLNLLDLAREYGVGRFVNLSTDEVYGELGDEGRFVEDSPLSPNSPYSVSKTAQDMLGRAYFRTYGLPVITVRPSNNYGPWQYQEKLVPVVVIKALMNEPIPIYGRGLNVREWLFVEDCAGALVKVMEDGRDGEIYNIASGEEKKNIEVVEAILEILGKPKDLMTFVKDRPGHDYRYSMDASKIYRELGWKAKVKFEEGIKKTVLWYVENIEWVKGKLEYLKGYWEKVYKPEQRT